MGKKVLVTPRSFVRFGDKENAYALLQASGFEVVENETGRCLTEEEIIELATQEVVGIVVGLDSMPAPVLESCRDLRAISKYGVGLNNIDLKRAAELGIKIKNAVGTNNISVAELTIGLIFAAARRIPQISTKVKAGSWDRVQGVELTDKKLGLIGGGQIGKEVAKRARGLGLEVMIYDPYDQDQQFFLLHDLMLAGDLAELLTTSDIISLHLPVTAETAGLINTDTLALMKESAILINTSRGELVDEEALGNALQAGKISFAAQDVFSTEPPPPGHPLVALDNFILTSHIGAYTQEAVERMVMTSTKNLLELLG